MLCDVLLRQKDVIYYEGHINPKNHLAIRSIFESVFTLFFSNLQNKFFSFFLLIQTFKHLGGELKYHRETPNRIFHRWGPIDRVKLQQYLNGRKDLLFETEEIEEIELKDWNLKDLPTMATRPVLSHRPSLKAEEPQYRLRALRCSDTNKIPQLYNELKGEIEAGFVAPYPTPILGILSTSMKRSSRIVEDIQTGLFSIFFKIWMYFFFKTEIGEIVGWYFSCRSSTRENTLFGLQGCLLPKLRGF